MIFTAVVCIIPRSQGQELPGAAPGCVSMLSLQRMVQAFPNKHGALPAPARAGTTGHGGF